MDTQKSPASRIRQILAAMERSIDTARSRRVSTSAPSASAAESSFAAPAHADNVTIAARAPATAPSIAKTNQVIGAAPPAGNPSTGASNSPANAPTQPPRLKARPKRFDGAFPTTFPQSTYRSQAG